MPSGRNDNFSVSGMKKWQIGWEHITTEVRAISYRPQNFQQKF